MKIVFKNTRSRVVWQWRTTASCPPLSHSGFWPGEHSALSFYWYLLHLLRGLFLQFDDLFIFHFMVICWFPSVEDEALTLTVSFLSFQYWYNKFWFYQYVDIKILSLWVLFVTKSYIYIMIISLYTLHYFWKLMTSSFSLLYFLYSYF